MPSIVGMNDPGALAAAEAALRAGDAIVLPTDTVYGLGALPDAAASLAVLKDRPESMPIAILVATVDEVASVGEMSGPARGLAEAFWPGPLTLVLRQRGGDGTIGVRCPDHDFVRALAGAVGPIAVTSANRHGEPTPPMARDAARSLSGDVALIVDGGPCVGVASTVVDVTDDQVAIIRVGPISEEQIRAAALR